MNAGSTITTAALRALYGAIIVGLLAGLTAMQTGQTDRDSIITGAIAALGVLITRGGFEGLYDAGRQNGGDVKPGDVQPVGKGNA